MSKFTGLRAPLAYVLLRHVRKGVICGAPKDDTGTDGGLKS